MLVYMLQREQAAETYDYEYDPSDAIWTDLEALQRYICTELDIDDPDKVKVQLTCEEPRMWVITAGRGNTTYHVTELETLP